MKIKFLENKYGYRCQTHSFIVLLFFSLFYIIFFSPVIFSDRLLSPGDGFVYYLPNFYSPKTLWEPLLLSGFPTAADPQTMTWYPLSWIFSLFPDSWNEFVISAYVLSSCFTYGYVYLITKSRFASLVSGMVYGMSGFMMAHLGHVSIIHAAVWLPLLVWSLEKLRGAFNIYWFCLSCVAITCCILAGHPQIFVYTVGFSTIYAVIRGWTAGMGRWKYYGTCLLILLCGIGMSAIQLIPTIELVKLGPRGHMTFSDFTSFSLSYHHIATLVFPYLFGGSPGAVYGIPYFGQWNLTELCGYTGTLSLILAAVGVVGNNQKHLSRTWMILAVFSLVLTFNTPLSKLFYHLPGYNKFRAPARHFVEFSFAVAVLTGLGIVTVLNRVVPFKVVKKITLISAGVVCTFSAGILLFGRQLQILAHEKGIDGFEVLPWSNSTIGLPLIIFVLSGIVLLYWSMRADSLLRQIVVLVIMIVNLSSFGWFYEWKYAAPRKDRLLASNSAEKVKNLLNEYHQRLLPVRGAFSDKKEFPVNVSKLWGIPSASGYGPLLLSRVGELLEMDTTGRISYSWTSPNNRNLDIMSIRYVLLDSRKKNSEELVTPQDVKIETDKGIADSNGFYWSQKDLHLKIGTKCGRSLSNEIMLNLPSAVLANEIGIVSSLGCAIEIPHDTEVVWIEAIDTDYEGHSLKMLAGRDTSEWSYDCKDVASKMRHKKATVFSSFPVTRSSSESCEGHLYLSVQRIEKRCKIQKIRLHWIGSIGIIGIEKVSLRDERTGKSIPVTFVMSSLSELPRWRKSSISEIGSFAYENLRAMPRVWLVPEVLVLNKDEILTAIKTSQLPDGKLFNPSKVALVEDHVVFKQDKMDQNANTRIVKMSKTTIQIRSQSDTASFLVLSDIFYPGWKVYIDGEPKKIYRTNYVLRGVKVPGGRHNVMFKFEPFSVYIGMGVTLTVIIGLILLVLHGLYSKCNSQKQSVR